MAQVATEHVLAALTPIWHKRPETASRVRGRIEAVLTAAKVKGLRDGQNPAAWKSHLDQLLPGRGKFAPTEHHPALPYSGIPDFFPLLQVAEGTSARALEFLILTCTRTGEALGATWQEVNLEGRLWTIPRERMKAGREHRVPLSAPAVALLRKMAAIRQGELVFRGRDGKAALSNMSLLMTLRRLGRTDLTSHGFRSTFRDWAAEQTSFPSELAEMALAHVVGDRVEAAYRRGDMLEKRRALAEAWGAYCTEPPAGAVPKKAGELN